MKIKPCFGIFIITFTTIYLFAPSVIFGQNKWPINPYNKKIEFKITKNIPQKLNKKVDFFQKWYFTYVTDLKKSEEKKWLSKTSFERTYANLPVNCYYTLKNKDIVYKLYFKIMIKNISNKTTVTLYDFLLTETGSDFGSESHLEEIVNNPASKENPVVNIFYDRITLAIKSM